MERSDNLSSDSGEIQKLTRKVELLEALLFELACACWEQCGTDWIRIALDRLDKVNANE